MSIQCELKRGDGLLKAIVASICEGATIAFALPAVQMPASTLPMVERTDLAVNFAVSSAMFHG